MQRLNSEYISLTIIIKQYMQLFHISHIHRNFALNCSIIEGSESLGHSSITETSKKNTLNTLCTQLTFIIHMHISISH